MNLKKWDGMKKIKLTQGKFALVDDEDFDYLNQMKWYFNSGTGYARTTIKGKKHYMHRMINKTPKGLHTDHIDRNKLNNCKSNLRTVTNIINSWNKGKTIKNTSGVNGVTWSKRYSKWQAQLKIKGINHYLGRYDNIKDAELARKQGEILYHGR